MKAPRWRETEDIVASLLGGRRIPGSGKGGEGDVWVKGIPVSVKSTLSSRAWIPLRSERRIANTGGRNWYLAIMFWQHHLLVVYKMQGTVTAGRGNDRKGFSVGFPPSATINAEVGEWIITGTLLLTQTVSLP